MNFKALLSSFGLSFLSSFAHAHPNKCDHTHGSGGISWEGGCGKRSHQSQSLTLGGGVEASPHEAHWSKHNLILFGEDEIFASHIVFKQPHNFQLILKVNFGEAARQHIALLRSINPDAQVVFLLDPVDLNSIAKVEKLSGVVKERGTSNKIVSTLVTLSKKDFEIIYFDELPLDLSEIVH
jgi:hypothetical protein